MKTHKRKLPVLILLAIFCFTLLHMTACKDKKQPDNPDPPDVIQTDYGIDNVYYAKDDGREYLFTISGNSFLISGFNGEQTGKFVYADGNLTLTFKTGDDTQASAVLENGVLKLTYNGGTYRMVPRTYYTVSFEVGGTEGSQRRHRNKAGGSDKGRVCVHRMVCRSGVPDRICLRYRRHQRGYNGICPL